MTTPFERELLHEMEKEIRPRPEPEPEPESVAEED